MKHTNFQVDNYLYHKFRCTSIWIRFVGIIEEITLAVAFSKTDINASGRDLNDVMYVFIIIRAN